MRAPSMVIAPAVAMLALAVAACQSAPGSGGTSAPPAAASSPSQAPLAAGSFRFPPMDATVEVDAAGEGSNVTGTLTISNGAMAFTTDLECALKAGDGRILIGGDVTESTFGDVPKDTRAAIVLKPGSPASAVFAWQGTDPRADTCTAFLEAMDPATMELAPIEGSVELGP